MDIGPCSIPTGEFLVADPLVYLVSKHEKNTSKRFQQENLEQKFVL